MKDITLGIRNFRAFDENGVEFHIAPITILTGCNSAGKSSMVKSLLLLDNFFRQMKQDVQLNGDCDPTKYRLGITNHELRLGNFASVLNRDAKSEVVSFSYTIKPLIASEPFTVTYNFVADGRDTLNDGWLHSIEITNTQKTIVCSLVVENGQLKMSKCNWSLLKDSFAQFGAYSLQRELCNQISINDVLPEASHYSEQDIQHFKEIAETIAKSGWTKSISTDNIQGFTNAYINQKETKSIFNDLSDVFMIQGYLEGNGLLHNLPIFDLLKTVSKDKVRATLQGNTAAWNADIDAIVSKFESSTFDTFADYIKDLEETQCLCSVGFDFGGGSWGHGLSHVLKNSLTYKYQFSYDDLDLEPVGTIETSDGKLNFIESALTENDKEDRKRERRNNMPFDFIIATLWKYSMEIDDVFKKKYSKESVFGEYLNGCEHPIVSVFAKYAYHLLCNLLIPSSIFDRFIYVGSSKAEAQRLYRVDSSNADSFEKTINDYFEAKRNCIGDYVPDTFLNKWIRQFNIGYSIDIRNTTDGLGIVVYLHSSEADSKGHLLADEGYGMTQLLSVLLNIETAILNSKTQNKIPMDRKIHGIALVHEEFEKQYSQACIAIEEPEIHLHPKYQSLLMDMFNDAYMNYNIHFIIETHSEYLVRRSQVLVAETKFKDENELTEICPYKVYYIPQPQDGKPYDLEYMPTGGFKKAFGEGFFDEAGKLDLIVLRNESSLKRR